MANICDSCLMAFQDEGAGEFIEDVLDLGADIPDHLCDRIEVGPEVQCDCTCKDGCFDE
jgi:hypothetical protein